MVDFPEATFQRNVHPLALLYCDPSSKYHRNSTLLSSIIAGLLYAAEIQHRDGSFDQAFPNEHSFGATAFLLHSLLDAFRAVRNEVDNSVRRRVEVCLRKGAEFLCFYEEEHGHISNHLAGATVSLLISAEHFREERYLQRAEVLLARILKLRSSEGWFVEYEGADPGYQTLCLYYLTLAYQQRPSKKLQRALGQSIEFISYFVHPDGTFGGEYGSRRTAIYYPGGLALLSHEFPLALAITKAMSASITSGHTVTLRDVDMGNQAPLLSNYICFLQAGSFDEEAATPLLPCEQPRILKDFPQAGLFIRGTKRYYAILGVSNGGVLKVFDKRRRLPIWDDCGYIGQLTNGTLVTTQLTISDRPCSVKEDMVSLVSHFYRVLNTLPTPFSFLILRLLNLTVMRSPKWGNIIKRRLVKLLVSGKRQYPLKLERLVHFERNQIIVKDRLSKSANLSVEWLSFGRNFVGIHMASANYFQGQQMQKTLSASKIDVNSLNQQNRLDVKTVIPVIRDSHA
jgi:hypothetical protein